MFANGERGCGNNSLRQFYLTMPNRHVCIAESLLETDEHAWVVGHSFDSCSHE